MRALLLLVVVAGCGDDLPQASFIDKLRILAVQLEPPEVAPGTATTATALAVEPIVSQADGPLAPVDILWLRCETASGALQANPCSVADTTLPPLCSDEPTATSCILGSGPSVSYTPDASQVGDDGRGEVLITVVAADVDGGGRQCLADIQGNGGKPKYPDRCVVGIKRLVVNGNAGARLNQNPRLDSLVLRVKNTNNDQSLLDGTATFALAEGDETPSFNLLTTRAADAAERDDAGNFEGLTIAWFTTSGKIEGGRSAFDVAGCAAVSDCPMAEPDMLDGTLWNSPTPDQLFRTTTIDREVRFWAVVRDDRGGVSWQTGTARARQ
jgi:hypothetical protein